MVHLRLLGLTIPTAVFEHSLSVAPVVLAGVLRVGLVVLFVGCADLLSVCSVIGPLLFQGSLSTLEVATPALLCTASFAARIVAIRVIVCSIVFGQWFALVAVPADFGLQDSEGTSFSVASLPSQET
jgi:hypothetical protein